MALDGDTQDPQSTVNDEQKGWALIYWLQTPGGGSIDHRIEQLREQAKVEAASQLSTKYAQDLQRLERALEEAGEERDQERLKGAIRWVAPLLDATKAQPERIQQELVRLEALRLKAEGEGQFVRVPECLGIDFDADALVAAHPYSAWLWAPSDEPREDRDLPFEKIGDPLDESQFLRFVSRFLCAAIEPLQGASATPSVARDLIGDLEGKAGELHAAQVLLGVRRGHCATRLREADWSALGNQMQGAAWAADPSAPDAPWGDERAASYQELVAYADLLLAHFGPSIEEDSPRRALKKVPRLNGYMLDRMSRDRESHGKSGQWWADEATADIAGPDERFLRQEVYRTEAWGLRKRHELPRPAIVQGDNAMLDLAIDSQESEQLTKARKKTHSI